MIRATRRTVIGGAALGVTAVSTVSSLGGWRWRHGDERVLLHDASLSAGQRFAIAGEAHGATSLAIEGDRVRFTRKLLENRPAMIAGVSRYADAMMIEDIAKEANYQRVALLQGRAASCTRQDCRSGWSALGRVAQAAGGEWIEALAEFAAKPAASFSEVLQQSLRLKPDTGLVLGWVLTPRS